ncbi:carboxypeptidase regulatory-like domain-containing protein [Aurantibacter sp.]|uniref:carboxypeptidase regulatory-like domain-containing protein n=1 Tax=Aurantibacter sp. TaxID=2807103 RepID=UPI0032679C94
MKFSIFFNIRILLFFNLFVVSSICAKPIHAKLTHSETSIKTDLHKKSVEDLLIEADIQFNTYHFEKAIVLYGEIIKTNVEPSAHVLQHMADSYFNINKYSEAGIWYLKLYDLQQGALEENYIIKLVECLKANRQIRKADEILINFYEGKEQLNLILTQKKHLNNQRRKNENSTLVNLPFNGAKSDFSPAINKDGLLFISSREKENDNYDLFIIAQDSVTSDGHFSNIITDSTFVPSLTFSRDSKTVYFTRNSDTNVGAENVTNQQILRATIRNNELTNIKVLSFNNDNYSFNHPSISADGKDLYFSSNMPGGFGESDIYKVTLNNNGDVISAPINLGSKINTAGREDYPFVQGQQLFFASDAHYGMGGLDIFSSRAISKLEYSTPLNMGSPVNSAMDDFSYIAESGRNNAYFTSNRVGGHGDNDIYQLITKEVVAFQIYSGYVLDESTKEPIANAHIQLNSISNKVNFTFETDANGYYTLKLPCNNQHRMVFYKENYLNNRIGIQIGQRPSKPSLNNIIYLSPLNKIEKNDNKSASINSDLRAF